MANSDRKTIEEWNWASTRYSQAFLEQMSDEDLEKMYEERVLRSGMP